MQLYNYKVTILSKYATISVPANIKKADSDLGKRVARVVVPKLICKVSDASGFA
jgi:hypothetical protein